MPTIRGFSRRDIDASKGTTAEARLKDHRAPGEVAAGSARASRQRAKNVATAARRAARRKGTLPNV